MIKQSSWLSIKMHKCSINEKKPQMRSLWACIFMKSEPISRVFHMQLIHSPSAPCFIAPHAVFDTDQLNIFFRIDGRISEWMGLLTQQFVFQLKPLFLTEIFYFYSCKTDFPVVLYWIPSSPLNTFLTVTMPGLMVCSWNPITNLKLKALVNQLFLIYY